MPSSPTSTWGREALRDDIGQPGDAVLAKAVGVLDEHCRELLALSPFSVLSTADADGRCDGTPRGGPPGFVRVLGPTRLAFGELPGNRLFDAAENIAQNPYAALLVLVPGITETLRIEGRAHVSRDEEVRAATAVDGKVPWGAVVIDVEQAFVHCGKAFHRSRLWQPEAWPAREELPRMGAVLRDHIAAPGPRGSGPDGITAEGVDADLAAAYEHHLW